MPAPRGRSSLCILCLFLSSNSFIQSSPSMPDSKTSRFFYPGSSSCLLHKLVPCFGLHGRMKEEFLEALAFREDTALTPCLGSMGLGGVSEGRELRCRVLLSMKDLHRSVTVLNPQTLLSLPARDITAAEHRPASPFCPNHTMHCHHRWWDRCSSPGRWLSGALLCIFSCCSKLCSAMF